MFCKKVERPHSKIHEEYPSWVSCPWCSFNFTDLQTHTAAIDLTGDTPEKPAPPVVALTVPGQSFSSRVGVRACTISHFINMTNIADEVKTQSKEDTRVEANKFKAQMNLTLYLGEYRLETVADTPTRKFTTIVQYERFTNVMVMLKQNFSTHTEMISKLLDLFGVDEVDRQKKWEFIGGVTSGSNASVVKMAIAKSHLEKITSFQDLRLLYSQGVHKDACNISLAHFKETDASDTPVKRITKRNKTEPSTPTKIRSLHNTTTPIKAEPADTTVKKEATIKYEVVDVKTELEKDVEEGKDLVSELPTQNGGLQMTTRACRKRTNSKVE